MLNNNKFEYFHDIICNLNENDIEFTYNGLNLYSSLQRHFYTITLNSQILDKCFFDIKNKNVKKLYFLYTAEEFDFAKILFNKNKYYPKLILINLKFFKHVLKYFFYRALSLFTPKLQKNINTFFVFVHHFKFIKLTEKLFSNIEDKISFVVTNQNLKQISYPKKYILLKLSNNLKIRYLNFRYLDISLLVEKYDLFFSNNQCKYVLTFEGDASYNEILAIISKKHKYLSICFQWGAFPWEYPKIGFRNFSHKFYLTWGKYFSEQLLPFNSNIFKEIGNPLINKLNNHPQKKILFLHQGYDDILISKQSYLSFWDLAIKLSKSLKDWEIIIRNHPNVSLTLDEEIIILENKITVHDSTVYSLEESFSNVSIAVTIMSSAIIEAAASGIVPIIFNPNFNKHTFKPDFMKLEMGYENDSIDVLYNHIVDLTNNEQNLNKLREKIKMRIPNLFYTIGDDSINQFQNFFLN